MDALYPVVAEADVAVVGGGMAGVAAALASAAAGRHTLLVESRPLLGWEAASAFSLNWPGADLDDDPFLVAMRSAGGVNGFRLDAPIVEMVLERLARHAGVELLLYSTPVALWRDGDRVGGVVVGNKSGRQIVRARAFIDATEEAALWRLAGTRVPGPACIRGRLAIFYNHVAGDVRDLQLPAVPGVGPLRALPSVWPGEVCISFEAEAPASGWGVPDALGLALRRAIPAVARALRQEVPAFADALLTHTGREPLPLTGPALGAGPHHPQVANLFGAGVWLASPDERETAGSLRARWHRGARVGEEAGRLAAEMPLPGLGAGGPDPEPAEAPACDVVVVGGGTGGSIAGIAAARQGARVTLLESSHFLGGIGAGGGIHWYYHGFTGGIQDEVDARTAELAEVFGARQRLHGFHPDAKQIALQELAEAAGVHLVFRTTLTGARCAGGRVLAAETAGPDGAVVYPAHAFVDATGDADLAALAGAEFTLGRERDELPHHFSQSCQFLDANGGIAFHNFDAGYVDATDVTDLTRARRLGLSHLWREEGFTPETRLLTISPLLGLRQSRQVIGDYVLTLDDQIRGRRFADAVSYARAHYDNHAFDYENESDDAALWCWILGAWLEPIACEVPYRCLLPRGVEGVLVGCRAISITHDAHMMLRMQRDLQRIGEAAGVAAALSALSGVTPRQLDVRRLQRVLLQSGILREEPVVAEQPDSLDAWVAALDSEEPKEAVWHLAHAEAAIPALLEVLQSGPERTRFWAAVALAMHRRPEAVPELLRCLSERRAAKAQGHRSVPFWQGAVVLLGRIGSPEAVPEILRLLQEPSTELDALIAAIRALGRIGDPSAVPALRALVQREDLPHERVLQVSTGGRGSVTEDARWQVDLAAAEALALLGAPDATLAEKHRTDPRAYVRRYAERVRQLSLVPVRY